MATDHDGPTGTRERDTATAGADAAPTPTADPAVTAEVVPLDTLTPLTDNPRTHTSRGIDFLKASLGRVGAARSGVIDEERTILAGNGMQDAATQVGYREAVVGLEGRPSDRLSIDGYHPRRLDGLDLANSRRYLPHFAVSSPHTR